jgi:predicted small lipoprotein YifL
MKKSTLKNITLCGFLTLPLLFGCGLKGDLYQTPPEEPTVKSNESVESLEQEER